MSYSARKLRLLIDDPQGVLRENTTLARVFCSAEDDGEDAEVQSLMDSQIHYANFWGVVRGPSAALAVWRKERIALRLTWTSQVTAVTAKTFERHGYVHFVSGGVASIPVIGNWLTRFSQQRVRESLVVDGGRIVFRDLSFQWGLGKGHSLMTSVVSLLPSTVYSTSDTTAGTFCGAIVGFLLLISFALAAWLYTSIHRNNLACQQCSPNDLFMNKFTANNSLQINDEVNLETDHSMVEYNEVNIQWTPNKDAKGCTA